MLVTFSTPAYADITLFGDIAMRFLELMGQSGTVPGALLAADVGGALERLEAGIAVYEEEAPSQSAEEEGGEALDRAAACRRQGEGGRDVGREHLRGERL